MKHWTRSNLVSCPSTPFLACSDIRGSLPYQEGPPRLGCGQPLNYKTLKVLKRQWRYPVLVVQHSPHPLNSPTTPWKLDLFVFIDGKICIAPCGSFWCGIRVSLVNVANSFKRSTGSSLSSVRFFFFCSVTAVLLSSAFCRWLVSSELFSYFLLVCVVPLPFFQGGTFQSGFTILFCTFEVQPSTGHNLRWQSGRPCLFPCFRLLNICR